MSHSSETPIQDSGESQNGEDLSASLANSESDFVTTEQSKPALNQGLLYLLLLIAIGGGGTYLMYKRQGPSSADAATVSTVQAQQTINNFLATGPSGIKTMREGLSNAEKIKQQFENYPSVQQQVPLSDLHTNPFRFAKEQTDAKPDEDALKKKKEEERAQAMRDSQSLKLQSIICSDTRKACMINNTLYLEGQQVDSFSIEKISANAVIVKTGVYRFELRMQK